MSNVEDLLAVICKESGKTPEQINSMVEDKSIEFSGMVTREAALHLVARELGVQLPQSNGTKLQVKSMVAGMRNVNLIARVFKISPINEFQKKSGEKGRVVNIFVSDGTGYTRVPLWNDQVKIVEDEVIKVGDAVQIFNGMTKENMYGEVEVAVGRFGGIRKVDDESLAPSLETVGKSYFSEGNARVSVSDLVPGSFEVKVTVVQVFRGNFLFEGDSGEKSLVMSCSVDDGTGDVRAVFFRDLAEKICGVSPKDLEPLSVDSRLELVKRTAMGREVVISGKVKKNKFFDKLEIVADSVKDINALDESKRLVEQIESEIGV